MKIKKIFKNSMQFLDMKKCKRLCSVTKSIPFVFLWVTNQCNLQCKMCDQWKVEGSNSQELTTKEWHTVIDSAAKMNTLSISITGGEPLLRPDIFQIIGRINKNKISCHLCTNGSLLDNKIVEKLKESPPHSISISLDSNEAEIHNEIRGKDCFNRVVNGIQLLKKHAPKIKIGINFLVNKKNFKNMDKMVLFAESLGVDRLNVQMIHTNLQHKNKSLESFKDLLFSKEDMPQLRLEIIKFREAISRTNLKTLSKTYIKGIPKVFNKNRGGFPCYAGYISCAIDPFGRVSPCEDIEGAESVRDRPLEHIWKSPSFQELRKKVHSCTGSCWDTTHTELNIRCSIIGLVQEFGEIIKDINYYLKK